MTSLTITRGLPASGKTEYAKRWVLEDPANRIRVNRDDLRNMLKVTSGPTIMAGAEEQALTEAVRAAVLAFTSIGRDVITDDTNLRPKYVREWRRWAVANNLDFQIVEFDIDLDESIIRDAGRDKPVGEGVIRRMGNYLVKGRLAPIRDEEEPPASELYVDNPNLPDAVIFDIDGTLADKGDRNPHDLSRVFYDTPIQAIVEAVALERAAGNQIIFLSGREGTSRCRLETEQWLYMHVDRDDETEPLYMRAEGDKRRDSIIKTELFDKHIRGHYNVRRIYDDRDQVVRQWRAMGLTCLQVASGDF